MREGFGASVKWSRTLVAPEQAWKVPTDAHAHAPTHDSPEPGGHLLSDKGMWSPKCASSLKFCDMALVMQQNTFVHLAGETIQCALGVLAGDTTEDKEPEINLVCCLTCDRAEQHKKVQTETTMRGLSL